jgi:hypothetical protein
LNLPFVTAQFRKPNLHLPQLGRREAGAAVGTVATTARSLSAADIAYYAGLGLLAAVEVIEWPVALVVAAGTALARISGAGGGTSGPGDTGSGGNSGPGDTSSGGTRGPDDTQAGGDRGSPGERAQEGVQRQP